MANRTFPITKTATAILLTTESDTLIVNRSTAAATYTLPAPQSNLQYEFVNAVDQNLIVVAPGASGVALNNLVANSIALQTAGQKIGGRLLAISDGINWFLACRSVGFTVTIA